MTFGVSIRIKSVVSRRRAIGMALGALAFPATAAKAGAAALPVYEWSGTALGAPARILIAHKSRKSAQQAVHNAIMELERIEDQFSLYRDTSQISRLNRDGHLEAPSLDMRNLLGISRHMSTLSNGAFDISVQPLWEMIARYVVDNARIQSIPDSPDLIAARRLVNHRRIVLSENRILVDDGMALTFNGIAQGYATDRVISVIRTLGFNNVLVELGEAYGMGGPTQTQPWQVGIQGRSFDNGARPLIPLAGRALAVSSNVGTQFAPSHHLSHILDPKSGMPVSDDRYVYVMHASATIADGLSTALCVMPSGRAGALLSRYPGAEAFEVTKEGIHTRLGSRLIQIQ
ncbi:MAG: FAD:protein FMN transferase [Alphaproteobacteria bacterium]|nr:FAD:protein FMN transferase [Alphaproteobacteria bacterium]